ncbi:hypothetical protein [Methanocella conradii]|uniref:hypothetical protein n=1 Tax=Methanocella conradii TaxID=1175444 RepID=UPI00157D15D5|nr:hypothetical protein [Methanocella conradii]
MVGWILLSLVPGVDTLTNIRDFARCLAGGDVIGSALFCSGIVLSLVDAGAISTATGAVEIFIKINPEKAGMFLKVLGEVLKFCPDSAVEAILRAFYNGAMDNIVDHLAVSGGLRQEGVGARHEGRQPRRHLDHREHG